MWLSPLLVLTAAKAGSGRVHVSSVGVASIYGNCRGRGWIEDASCATMLQTMTYRITEGALLGEKAQPPGDSQPRPCPLGTCPRPIFVPPAPGSRGSVASNKSVVVVSTGLREGVCVSACDGGGKANATTRAVEYASPPPPETRAFTACPTDSEANFGFACEPGCLSWQGPCCAIGSVPGPSADCPACPPTAWVDKEKPVDRARLRLASIVAPDAKVPCADFSRLAAAEIATAYNETKPVFSDYARSLLPGCPPRDLELTVTGGCRIELSSPSGWCPLINSGKGAQKPLILAPKNGGAAAVALGF